jgi:hypothetical protein
MFNTIVHKHDYGLASKERGELQQRLDNRDAELRRAVTPESLKQGVEISRRLEEKLVFDYVSTPNSLLQLVVSHYQTERREEGCLISFLLNDREISITIPFDVIRDSMLRPHALIDKRLEQIKKAVADEIANEIALASLKESLTKE